MEILGIMGHLMMEGILHDMDHQEVDHQEEDCLVPLDPPGDPGPPGQRGPCGLRGPIQPPHIQGNQPLPQVVLDTSGLERTFLGMAGAVEKLAQQQIRSNYSLNESVNQQ